MIFSLAVGGNLTVNDPILYNRDYGFNNATMSEVQAMNKATDNAMSKGVIIGDGPTKRDNQYWADVMA